MVNCSSAKERGFRGFHPLELVAMILGFVFFWPIGLAILVFKLCGGQFPRFAGPEWQAGPWSNSPWSNSFWPNSFWGGSGWQGWQGTRNSNQAFEDYKRSTLERLEAERRKLAEEERAFADFLRELRSARDREEFDRFMQSRQQGSGPPPG
jgi:Protein of unknown function (DUF2852)